jgi:tetratricopeptide (TPR) repeat protein
MANEDLLSRLKKARIVQVLVVYFGASWVVLQIAEILQEAFALPSWVLPFTILLLLIGMVVILSTAWVQSLASTTAAEEAGEVPTDWQIAPAKALESLTRGKLPHLTWGRAILGGVVAISLLFGASGLYVIVTGGESLLGPTPAGADVAAEGIAVVPFDVRGDDLEIWREGMMDLLSNNLDGVGGYRTIDSRTVMSRWNAQVGDDPAPDLRSSLQAAGATGARYALLGSVVGLGSSVRLVANLYDLDTGEEVAQGSAEGPADEVLTLADDLAVETMRSLLLATGSSAVDQVQAETITTHSLPALREFLSGESAYRRGDFAGAVQAYERAVAEDSTFAIALVRLTEAYGWLESANSERIAEYSAKALTQRDRLSPRYQFLIDSWDAYNRNDVSGVATLRSAVQKYPDDPEAWFLLAETYIHLGDATYATDEDIWQALERAVSLDPDFAPYLIHYGEHQVIRGDTAGARTTLERYAALTGTRRNAEHIGIAIPLLYGTDTQAQEAVQTLRDADASLVDYLVGTFQHRVDQYDRLDPALEVVEDQLGQNRDAQKIYSASTQGGLGWGADLAESLGANPVVRTLFSANVAFPWDLPLDEVDPSLYEVGVCGEVGRLNTVCAYFLGFVAVKEGRFGRVDTILDRMTREIDARQGAAEAGDEAQAAVIEGLEQWHAFLVVYRDWARSGDPVPARRYFDPLKSEAGNRGLFARIAMGDVEARAGRTEEAIRHYQATLRGYQRSYGLLQLARMHDRAGRPSEARHYYERLLRVGLKGDPDLPAMIEAREALERLGP